MEELWNENWRAVSPPGAVRFDLPNGGSRLQLHQQLGQLPAGTVVALSARGVGSPLRCARFARHAGLKVVKTYLQLPSSRAPAVLVEAAPGSLHYVLSSVATVPPGTATLAPLYEFGLRVLRQICSTRLAIALAPNCLLIGVHA